MKTIQVTFSFSLQLEIPDIDINNSSLILADINEAIINLDKIVAPTLSITEVYGDIKQKYAEELIGSVI